MDAYTTAAGEIDEHKVMGHLTAIYASRMSPQSGDDARTALKKRHNVGVDNANQPAPGAQITRGADARAELQKRYRGKKR